MKKRTILYGAVGGLVLVTIVGFWVQMSQIDRIGFPGTGWLLVLALLVFSVGTMALVDFTGWLFRSRPDRRIRVMAVTLIAVSGVLGWLLGLSVELVFSEGYTPGAVDVVYDHMGPGDANLGFLVALLAGCTTALVLRLGLAEPSLNPDELPSFESLDQFR